MALKFQNCTKLEWIICNSYIVLLSQKGKYELQEVHFYVKKLERSGQMAGPMLHETRIHFPQLQTLQVIPSCLCNSRLCTLIVFELVLPTEVVLVYILVQTLFLAILVDS